MLAAMAARAGKCATRWPTAARIIFATTSMTTSHGTAMGAHAMGAHAMGQAVASASCAQVTFLLHAGDRVGHNSRAVRVLNMNHDRELY